MTTYKITFSEIVAYGTMVELRPTGPIGYAALAEKVLELKGFQKRQGTRALIHIDERGNVTQVEFVI